MYNVAMLNNNIQVDEERFRKEFDLLSQIGATDKGGVHRPTFSVAHLEARSWIRDKALEAGLGFKIDQAGNHSLLYPAHIMAGHHLSLDLISTLFRTVGVLMEPLAFSLDWRH